jgi:transposase-like protein
MDSLASFLRKHYGSVTQAAAQFGVTEQTVYKWIRENPKGLLKHMPTMVTQCNVTETQILGEVMYQQELLEYDEQYSNL